MRRMTKLVGVGLVSVRWSPMRIVFAYVRGRSFGVRRTGARPCPYGWVAAFFVAKGTVVWGSPDRRKAVSLRVERCVLI
jgi:hypothetical protein